MPVPTSISLLVRMVLWEWLLTLTLTIHDSFTWLIRTMLILERSLTAEQKSLDSHMTPLLVLLENRWI